MLPKVQAAIQFVTNCKNKKNLIAELDDGANALKSLSSTTITFAQFWFINTGKK